MQKQIFITLFILSSLLVTASHSVQAQMVGTELPDLIIQNINVSSKTFREDEVVRADLELHNNDSNSFNNLRLSLRLGQTQNEPNADITFNEAAFLTIDTLDAGETLRLSIEFNAEAGSYIIQLIIVFNNQDLVNTAVTRDLQILSVPVGNNKTILLALGMLFSVTLIMILSQSVYDRLRFYGNGKGQ